MLLERVNLQRELERYRRNGTSRISEPFHDFKSREKKSTERILEDLQKEESAVTTDFIFDLLDTQKIFHISHIQKLCIDYRLRFLPSGFFKGDIPEEAISRVKELEAAHETSLRGFYLMAPSKNFRLKNADDPLLFAAMGNGYYYLIHKWGNDLHPLRKLFVWPLKNMENLAIFTVVFSFLFTFVLRELFFARYQTTSEFIMLFLFSFKSMVGLLVFYGVALGKNFNNGIWKSRHFNA